MVLILTSYIFLLPSSSSSIYQHKTSLLSTVQYSISYNLPRLTSSQVSQEKEKTEGGVRTIHKLPDLPYRVLRCQVWQQDMDFIPHPSLPVHREFHWAFPLLSPIPFFSHYNEVSIYTGIQQKNKMTFKLSYLLLSLYQSYLWISIIHSLASALTF